MNNQQISKKNQNNPVSLLIHGCNDVSINIAKSLTSQGGNVIVVDNYNQANKKYISILKESPNADFVDFKGLNDLLETLPRIDYIFYFLHNHLISAKGFSSKDFLDETTYLNTALSASKKFNSKFSLITTIKLNQELSAHILNSNLSAPSPYSPIELQKYCETLTAENRDKMRINARIIRIGTILGSTGEVLADQTVHNLINEAINKTELTIYGEGLDIHYLININDLTYGILKLTFSDKTEGEVISLTNNHDYTTLSLAYKLLELNPELLQIKFLPAKEGGVIIFDQYLPAKNASEYGWSQKTQIEESLIQTISTYSPEKGRKITQAPSKKLEDLANTTEKIRVVDEKTPIGKAVWTFTNPLKKGYKNLLNWLKGEQERFNTKRLGMLLIYIALTLVSLYYFFIPITSLTISGISIYKNSNEAIENLKTFDFQKASENLTLAQESIKKTQNSLNTVQWLFKLSGQQDLYENIFELLFASDYATLGASTLTQAFVPLANYAKEFEPSIGIEGTTPSTSREYRIYLNELQNNLKGIDKATYNLSIGSQLLSKVNLSVFPQFIQKPLSQVKLANESIVNQIIPAQEIIKYIPELLGVNSRQRYLILLQNPTELRSTGGWLTSYAIVSIDGGQLRELKVDDIYNVEGQLKVAGKTFEAPKDMQKALSLTNWSMSLSNWNPDFPLSAKSAEFFLNQIDPGTEFNGVIAIDTNVIKKLLDKWNGLVVPGENGPITSANLDQKIFQLHTSFVPGQSLKTTFLANLANEALKKIFSLEFQGYADIADVIYNSLEQKHLLIYLPTQANKYFNDNNWNGSIKAEYMWTPISVDWNWGANKANLFIEKNHNLLVNVKDENSIEYEYTIFVQNKSKANIYPEGDYINFLRIYLPKNADVSSIKGFKDNRSSTIIDGGYKVVSGWFNTNIRSTSSLQIKYKLEKNENDLRFPITINGKENSLDLLIYKQPGTNQDLYDLSIIFPESWATKNTSGMTQAINTLTNRFRLETDKEFKITWEKK